MYKLWISLTIATLLLAGLAFTVTGQEDSPLLARLQPLLVDVQQRVPISVTLAIPLDDGDTQTVTVPIELDLNLQIGLASTMTPVLSVEPAGSALVTISELMEQGEPLIDNWEIPYELEGVDGIEIIQMRSAEDGVGEFEILGELRNEDPNRNLDRLELVVSFYDADGNLLDVSNGYMQLDTVQPGGTSPFRVITSLPFDDVARYKIQIQADFER